MPDETCQCDGENGYFTCPVHRVKKGDTTVDSVWLALTGAGNWLATPSRAEAEALVGRWNDDSASVAEFVPRDRLDRVCRLAAALCKTINDDERNGISNDTVRALVALRLAVSPTGAVDHMVETNDAERAGT